MAIEETTGAQTEGEAQAAAATTTVVSPAQHSLTQDFKDLGLPKEFMNELGEIHKENVANQAPAPAAPANNLEASLGVETPAGEAAAAPAAESEAAGGEKPKGEAPAGKKPEGERTLEDEFKVDSPLLGGPQTIGAANESSGSEEQNFENIEKLSSHLKDKYGIENVNSIGSEFERLQATESDYNELTTKHDNVKTLFETMPSELHQAITLFTKGEDWRAGLQQASVDFGKALGDIPKKELVSAMMPGKITEDDWKEFEDKEDGDLTVKRMVQTAIETSEGLFGSKKQAFESAAASKVQSAQDSKDLFDASVVKSRGHLKAAFGNAEPKVLDEIQSMSTQAGVLSLFFNPDGSLKEDGMYNLAMAKHGKGLVEQYRVIAEHKAETKVNQENLARTPESPATTQGSQAAGSKEGIRPEVQKMVDDLKGQDASVY